MRGFCRVILFCLLLPAMAVAQQGGNVWSLQRSVQYAIEHNISVKQGALNARLSKYALQQSQLSQLPSVNFSGSYGRSFGRSINPTTNQFVEGGYNFLSASGSASAVVFGWMQVRNTIARNKYTLEASLADLEQLKDDISLNVANGFLVALMAQEQINISRNQVGVSKAQLDQTRAFAQAGRLPELNVAQLESQLATDSANLINSIASYNAAILDLKALLNLDFGEPFDIQIPDVTAGDQLSVAMLKPEDVYSVARGHFGSVLGSKYRVSAAQKGVSAAKAGLYPQLTVGYQAGTNYSDNYQTVSTYRDTVLQNGSFILDGNNRPAYVYEPYRYPVLMNTPFNTQFENNLRQTLSVNLNIPIFNGWQSQYGIRQARINLETQRLNEYSAELTLKQNVYKAHNNAINSVQKYQAAIRANEAASRALDFARKRYDLGLTSTVDLLVTQNTQFNAASNLVIAKYDLIFKLKVIDYYLGKEIKL